MVCVSLDLRETLGNIGVVGLSARSIIRHWKAKDIVVDVVELSRVKAFGYKVREPQANRVGLNNPVSYAEEPEQFVSQEQKTYPI